MFLLPPIHTLAHPLECRAEQRHRWALEDALEKLSKVDEAYRVLLMKHEVGLRHGIFSVTMEVKLEVRRNRSRVVAVKRKQDSPFFF